MTLGRIAAESTAFLHILALKLDVLIKFPQESTT